MWGMPKSAHPLYLENHVKFVYGKKSCLCVRQTTVQKLMCLNWLKFVPREIFKFCQNWYIFASAGPSTFLHWTLKEVRLSKNWGDINQLQTKLPLINIVTIATPRDMWHHSSFMQTGMAALKFRFATFHHFLSWQKDGGYVLLVQVEFSCKGIWKI